MPETRTDTLTILDALRKTTDYFASHGIADNPRLNAELLLVHTLKLNRIDLYVRFEQPLTPLERDTYRELVRQRAKHMPLAYLTREAHFMGWSFYVDERVLIPRPETEHLVERAIELLRVTDKHELRAADLGAGSGCIGLSLAASLPQLKVTAVDASDGALDVARKNAAILGVETQVEFLHGNWLAPLREHGLTGAFDLIASNPPYIAEHERPSLQPEVRDYEPAQALFSGPTGLEALTTLINEAAEFLTPRGWLLLEVGYTQRADVEHLAAQAGHYAEPQWTLDLQGHHRVCCLQHS